MASVHVCTKTGQGWVSTNMGGDGLGSRHLTVPKRGDQGKKRKGTNGWGYEV